MVTLIVLLLILGFLQNSLIPLNLTLIVLISRAFVIDDEANLYLAFAAGLWLSFLLNYHLGFLSLFYIFIVLVIRLLKKVEFFAHWTVVLPMTLVILLCNQVVAGIIAGESVFSSININTFIAEGFFVLPIYLLILMWEERLVPRKDIRLKLGR